MPRTKLPREFYIPKGATKIADRHSDAVAYLYDTPKGRLGACVFFGRQAAPVWNYLFSTPAAREARIRQTFEGRRASAKAKSDRLAERKAWVPDYKPGDILYTSWGYEQTNVDFYEVTAVRGKHVELRQLAQAKVRTDMDQGRCVPQSGSYIGQPFRRLAQRDGIRITSFAYAHRWAEKTVAGVPVGPALHWTSYH